MLNVLFAYVTAIHIFRLNLPIPPSQAGGGYERVFVYILTNQCYFKLLEGLEIRRLYLMAFSVA